MEKKAITCPQCGSSDLLFISTEQCVCQNCKTTVMLEKEKQPIVVQNNIKIDAASDTPKTVPAKYSIMVIEKEITEKDFFKNMALKFALDKRTTKDFFDSKFSPVTTTYDSLSTARGFSEIKYTASVGYNKIVQHNVNGTKFPKTITEWHPFTSSKNGDYTSSTLNGKVIDDQKTREKYLEILKNSKQIKPEDSGISDASLFGFTQEEQLCLKERINYYSKKDAINSLPGDTYKDFSCNVHTEMKNYTKTLIPRYNIEFKYNEKDFKYTANAVGSDDSSININNTFANNFYKQFYNDNKTLSLITIISACICFALFLLGTEWAFLTWIAIIPLLTTIGAGLPLLLKFNKLIEKASAKNKSLKKERFIEFCSKYNLTPPTQEELKQFDNI